MHGPLNVKFETQREISCYQNEELSAPTQITSWNTTPYQLAKTWRHAMLLWHKRQICLKRFTSYFRGSYDLGYLPTYSLIIHSLNGRVWYSRVKETLTTSIEIPTYNS